jgi:hypothetical protein|tara:strand:- start:9 stop:599 length:591 start_codon:yes stop_codon:yes gene_type:complete
MAKKQVDLGTPNQGDGTPIRDAFGFLNDNHTELYSLLGNGTTLSVTGDVAISSGAATIQAGSVENSMLADNAVDHDELANRFANRVDKTDTGNFTIDCSAGSVFFCTGNIGTANITIDNLKQNQVIDLVLDGTLSSAAITLVAGTGLGTTAFNKVGTTSIDQSKKNHITLICAKEDSVGGSVVNYTINSYDTDTTP